MRKIILFICICFLAVATHAQENPVTWSFAAEHVEGSQYLITFTADIKKDWVVYSQHIDEGGPIPTGFYFDENSEVEFIGKVEEKSKSETEMDKLFEMEVTKFKNQAVFEQTIELKDKTAQVGGELEYMTCDGNRCLPPTTIDFNIKVE